MEAMMQDNTIRKEYEARRENTHRAIFVTIGPPDIVASKTTVLFQTGGFSFEEGEMTNKDKAYKRPKDFPDDVDEYPELNDYVDKLVSTQYHDASGLISWIVIAMVIVGVALMFIFNPLACHRAHAEEQMYTNKQIADAIYKAEGGEKAKVPYGILSVKVKDEAEARRVCINTIRNNRKRYADYGHKQYDTYLEFLASRYAPVEAHPLNKNWLKNVRYFLERGKQ